VAFGAPVPHHHHAIVDGKLLEVSTLLSMLEAAYPKKLLESLTMSSGIDQRRLQELPTEIPPKV
jgi:hypothetical protein